MDSDTFGVVEKVTAFVIHPAAAGPELLLIEHPHAGIQIPAGTVEAGETPEIAVLREVAEETGLAFLSLRQNLGSTDEAVPEGQALVMESTRAYSRPDIRSFDWAHLRKGLTVVVHRRAEGFSQVTYEEFDRVPYPQYVSLRITGWVPDGVLTQSLRRHYFLLEFEGQAAPRWTVAADNHFLTLFWAPLDALPEIIAPQNEWLKVLLAALRRG